MAKVRARLNPDSGVVQRRRDGNRERIQPRADWARVDATAEAEIAGQAAEDDAEAVREAALWARWYAGAPGFHKLNSQSGSTCRFRPCAIGSAERSPLVGPAGVRRSGSADRTGPPPRLRRGALPIIRPGPVAPVRDRVYSARGGLADHLGAQGKCPRRNTGCGRFKHDLRGTARSRAEARRAYGSGSSRVPIGPGWTPRPNPKFRARSRKTRLRRSERRHSWHAACAAAPASRKRNSANVSASPWRWSEPGNAAKKFRVAPHALAAPSGQSR